jgi:hypothetical protein
MFALPSTCEAGAQQNLVQARPVGIRQSFVEAPPRALDAVNVPRDIRLLAVGGRSSERPDLGGDDARCSVLPRRSQKLRTPDLLKHVRVAIHL